MDPREQAAPAARRARCADEQLRQPPDPSVGPTGLDADHCARSVLPPTMSCWSAWPHRRVEHCPGGSTGRHERARPGACRPTAGSSDFNGGRRPTRVEEAGPRGAVRSPTPSAWLPPRSDWRPAGPRARRARAEVRDIVVHMIEEYARHCRARRPAARVHRRPDRPVGRRLACLGCTSVDCALTHCLGLRPRDPRRRRHRARRVVPRARARRRRRTTRPAPGELTALDGRRRRAAASRREVRRVEIADLAGGPGDAPRTSGCACTCSRTGWCGPHAINLDGVFGLLTNVVWTSAGPVRGRGLRADPRRGCAAAGQHVTVLGVDKFPRMVDYVLPTGVRIADADRVRLGAHLAEGTTVMHEGFVNYNAGTLGASMVEGRISAGVVVGDGSDVGGGASIMGTLSGGGKEVISIGERCLLGANAGIGISLGDDCVVEAGCYVTAGTKVTVPDMDGKPQVVKARRALRAPTTCCSAATRSPAPSRRCRGRARASRSTPPCTPTDGPGARRTGAAPGRGRRARRSSAAVGVAVTARRRPARPTPRAAPPTVDGHTVDARPRAGRERRADRGDRGRSAACRPGPPRSRWPRRTRSPSSTTSSTATATRSGLFQQRPSQGWGTRAADPRPVLRDQRLLRRAGEGRRLRDDADHRGRPGGAALRLPRGLRRPRGRRPGARLGADRQLAARVQLRRARRRPTRRRDTLDDDRA